jgi:hypothetical protein
MAMDFEFETETNKNGVVYCKNSRQIVEYAQAKGLKLREIAVIAGGVGDPSTISGWKTKGGGDLEMCKRVYEHLKNL